MLGVADPFSLGCGCTAFRLPRSSAVGLIAASKQETLCVCGISLYLFVATLRERYFFFLGVSVLSDEITSIASKHEIRDTTLGTTADCTIFVTSRKWCFTLTPCDLHESTARRMATSTIEMIKYVDPHSPAVDGGYYLICPSHAYHGKPKWDCEPIS